MCCAWWSGTVFFLEAPGCQFRYNAANSRHGTGLRLWQPEKLTSTQTLFRKYGQYIRVKVQLCGKKLSFNYLEVNAPEGICK